MFFSRDEGKNAFNGTVKEVFEQEEKVRFKEFFESSLQVDLEKK